MAVKKKSMSAAEKKGNRAVKVPRTAKNKAARLEKHLAKHPNDKQSAKVVGKPRSERKKPYVKGSAPAAGNRYRDPVTGQPVTAPLFGRVVE